MSPAQKEDRRQKKLAAKQDRVKSAKTMDLSYFLEMVDVKHRYGSNLRKYHAEWQRRTTQENFFYWLDFGEGKDVELPTCSRDRLSSMQVRYLSKEERKQYEVVVNAHGKLCWKKDGVRVDTTDGMWKDSIVGIVRADSDEPAWAHDRPRYAFGSSESSALESEDEKEKQSLEELRTPSSASPEDSKKHRSFHDFLKSPTTRGKKEDGGAVDVKPEKKKVPKQKWIFVSSIQILTLQSPTDVSLTGRGHQEQSIHRT